MQPPGLHHFFNNCQRVCIVVIARDELLRTTLGYTLDEDVVPTKRFVCMTANQRSKGKEFWIAKIKNPSDDGFTIEQWYERQLAVDGLYKPSSAEANQVYGWNVVLAGLDILPTTMERTEQLHAELVREYPVETRVS